MLTRLGGSVYPCMIFPAPALSCLSGSRTSEHPALAVSLDFLKAFLRERCCSVRLPSTNQGWVGLSFPTLYPIRDSFG